MAVLSIIGSKGGVGTSLVATNLGCALANSGSTLLIDAKTGNGVDDLLLDSVSSKSWTDLIPVRSELLPRHIDLATSDHPAGLKILCGPAGWQFTGDDAEFRDLVRALSERFDWCLIDMALHGRASEQGTFSISDVIILVTSADPPALRSARRFLNLIPAHSRERVGLVINQINKHHPSTPGQIADSLHLPLLASLPPDTRSVGYQVHFGRACVLDPASPFGGSIHALGTRLRKSASVQIKPDAPSDPTRGQS